ncbi:helix-turn-helix domain-containing protein [Cognaticolwellia mytili]|uniref:helix-turn-helix domain-containing protein n=1 Tax=Cognaticolwellia mytili TaxID=1888913 RepID=UPI000A16DEC5|nr:helix-turn-helix domain-containing protein [Cognaticolwellia mytili]
MSHKYFSGSQHRMSIIVMSLVGAEANGLTMADISEKSGESKSNVLKTLANLEAVNWVEKHPANDKVYRLTPLFSQIANTIQIGLRTAVQQLEQDQTNYNKII